MKIILKILFAVVLPQFFSPIPAAPEESSAALPRIGRLDTRDVVFKQFLDDVEAGRKTLYGPSSEGGGAVARELTLYSYTPTPEDDFFRLAARCNIPYDAIATLNRLSHTPAFPDGALILPSMPGVFMPENPESDLEKLILSSRGAEAGVSLTINTPGGRQRFRFIPGDKFTPNERAFFLNPGRFGFPLQKFTLTSAFGQRISPISGRLSAHSGLDLAAPQGTEVSAAGEGVVIETSQNPVYGKYVVIQHEGGWTSLYGHLSSITVDLRTRVKQGTLIGRVGSTGLSTGPHLHFELRQNGKAQDPVRLLGGASNTGK
jgi:murein DD-endopeptidase MepM/ murein hydrolase activator NlpD